MNFKIVRNDISEMSADAIVLPANRKLLEGSGASSAIFEKAGREKLQNACKETFEKYKKKDRDIRVGTAVFTHAFNLDADFIIHAIVPRWIDGSHDEYSLLSSSYLSSLSLADNLHCKSIAFPLLASGNNGYDLDLAFRIAKNSIESYESQYELSEVYLVVYGQRIIELLRRYGIDTEEVVNRRKASSMAASGTSHKTVFNRVIDFCRGMKKGVLERARSFTENEKNQDKMIEKGKGIASNAKRELFTMSFPQDGVAKKIHLMVGNICDIKEPVDLVVCSAFKDNYDPVPGTLIGSLNSEKGIDIRSLAKEPELDLRKMGCWLSKETGTCFSRIACVELLSLWEKENDDATDNLLKSTFSTLKFLCEQASYKGVSIRNIVMPILGTGNQNIDINYVAPVLLAQLRKMFDVVDGLTDIYIYDRNPEKARHFSEILSRVYNKSGKQTPDVFISYSSKQADLAHQIFETFTGRNISCWIAPESISPGSDYIDDISAGIGTTRLTVLVLTPDAEKSRWVQKEVKTTIGSDHILIPYQEEPYAIGEKFQFILEGEQILEAWKLSEDTISQLADCVCSKLAESAG